MYFECDHKILLIDNDFCGTPTSDDDYDDDDYDDDDGDDGENYDDDGSSHSH